jgi:hypothetical protein
MTEHKKAQKNRSPALDEQPLLRVLVFEATRRAETLSTLAKHLGVTYERLAQWRRNEGLISNAHRDVHERAARYLGWPTVLVLAMAGTLELQDFVWPGSDPLDMRVSRDLERLRQDPFLGAFFPTELATAAPGVRLFVCFLVRQLARDNAQDNQNYNWIRAAHLATAGHADGQAELNAIRRATPRDSSIF